MRKNYFLTIILSFITSLIFGQNIKVKSEDIKDLKIEINNLKIENQKLSNEVFQLKENLSQIQNDLKSNYYQHSQNIDRLQKSISFLGQDLNDILKGYTKTLPERYNKEKNNLGDSNNEVKKEAKSEYSGQCNATTKKGTRCSRSARSNGYCWQHGG